MAQPVDKKDGRKGNGGPRKGSGRKPLNKRKTLGPIAQATRKLDLMQTRCAEAIDQALDATKEVAVVVVDKEGKVKRNPSTGKKVMEILSVPDHPTRIKAAELAMRKRIPDLSKVEMTEPDEAKEIRERAKREADKQPVVELIRSLAELAKK